MLILLVCFSFNVGARKMLSIDNVAHIMLLLTSYAIEGTGTNTY